MLSGNRNFEGRIHPECKMNFLTSPPLVIAYALAGTMHADLLDDPLGTGTDGQPVYLRDIWPSTQEIEEVIAECVQREMFTRGYADVFTGDDNWRSLDVARRADVRLGRHLHLRPPPAVLRRHEPPTRSR